MTKKIKFVNELKKEQEIEVGDFVVLESPIKGDINKKTGIGNEHRYAHILDIDSPFKIKAQMYTNGNNGKTAEFVNIDGIDKIIKYDFNVFVSSKNILKKKKNKKITEEKIKEINLKALKERQNYEFKKIADKKKRNQKKLQNNSNKMK